MKKLIIPFLAVMMLIFTSCEETEAVTYDGSQTLAYFNGTGATLEVELGSTATIDIPIGVSTISNVDRTVNVSVVESATTATPGMYSIGTGVIPANSYTGTITVTGVDDGLTTAGATVTLSITGLDGAGAGVARTFNLRLLEICPIPATFAVGNYTLTTQSGGIAAAGFAPAMGNNVTVNLVVGSSSTERRFNVKFYPSFGFTNPPVNVSFGLSCEETVFNGIVAPGASGVGCGGSIQFGTPPNNGAYDTTDDSVITLVYMENTNEMCGNAPAEGRATLTKQ